MGTSVERKSIRKAAALAWREEHRGFSPRGNAFNFRDDDQDKKIPRHGRRGKGRQLRPDKSALQAVKTSKDFSTILVIGASVASFWKGAEQIVGIDVPDNSGVLRAVLDTNVVFAGLLAPNNKDGASRRLMELALDEGKVLPLVTWPIIEEYQRVCFGYDHDFKFLCRLLSRSELVPSSPAVVVPEVSDDSSDTPFLEALALSLRGLAADERPQTRLVTWDKHLLQMNHDKDLPEPLRGLIIDPREALWELNR